MTVTSEIKVLLVCTSTCMKLKGQACGEKEARCEIDKKSSLVAIFVTAFKIKYPGRETEDQWNSCIYGSIPRVFLTFESFLNCC